MNMIGHARASAKDQDVSIQNDALKAAGCSVIRSEKRSGTTTAGRAELATVLEFLREGDALVVTKLDRLARSVGDLSAIVDKIAERRASLRVLNAAIDTATPTGRAFLQMLGVFSEFETAIRRERQLEGIAKAKKEGVYKGRKATIDGAAILRLKGTASVRRRSPRP